MLQVAAVTTAHLLCHMLIETVCVQTNDSSHLCVCDCIRIHENEVWGGTAWCVATGLASGHIALRILKSTPFCALLHWQLDVALD